MDISLKRMVLGPVGTNCFIFCNEETKEAVVFDPGDMGDRVFSYIKDQGMELKSVILTHGHFDHITGVPEL
ncbi:MAG: MBL fold metallo-hydrolase, partial [Lachnospiraceae bacterium]|nr:MBL fold metallo-hydrolase [Lachnospiraceae bacterium]